MQLSNLQKLAERQSCYSGPKENLIEARRRKRKRPTKKSEGKLHRTKPWERRDQLGGATKSQVPMKRRQRQASKAPIKEHQSNQWNGANHMQYRSNQTPIEPNKGSALPSKGKQEKDQAPNQIEALN